MFHVNTSSAIFSAPALPMAQRWLHPQMLEPMSNSFTGGSTASGGCATCRSAGTCEAWDADARDEGFTRLPWEHPGINHGFTRDHGSLYQVYHSKTRVKHGIFCRVPFVVWFNQGAGFKPRYHVNQTNQWGRVKAGMRVHVKTVSTVGGAIAQRLPCYT